MSTVRGRQIFMEGLVANGASAIFGNPGTTENPLLDTLVDFPQLPYYVALQESIAMGAATFHALGTGRLSVVNLHVAPGLGNAIGMMFGALKACAPVLVTAGQQDLRMRMRDPVLSHDLVSMAKPVSKWTGEPQSVDEIAPMLKEAIHVALTPPYGPVFMSMPVNVFAAETRHPGDLSIAVPAPGQASEEQLSELMDALARSERPAIVAGDDVTRFGGFEALIQVAERCNATVYVEGLRAHLNFPNRHPNFGGRLLFEGSAVRKTLAAHDLALLIGGPFFESVWYDETCEIPDDLPLIRLEQSPHRLNLNFSPDLAIAADIGDTLTRISERLESRAHGPQPAEKIDPSQHPSWDALPMSAGRALSELAAVLPDDCVVVDESITAYPDVNNAFDFSAPHHYYAGRGGGIGQGIAGAIGSQVAHPDKTVVAISGDGSAMYSIQALWTAAHHNLPIVFVILANREYRVLKHNLDIYRARYEADSNRPYPHMDLDGPAIDFVQAASAHGVKGARVERPEDIAGAVETALSSGGPALIEIAIAGKQ